VRGRNGDLAGALEAAEKGVAADPSDSLALLRKAELLIDLGLRNEDEAQLAEARKIVLDVTADDPSSAEAAFVRAKSEIAAGNPEEAIEALREAIATKPDWPQAHFVLGSALLIANDLHRARAELARAVELSPGLAPARKLLVRVHSELGEHEYAIQNARRYLERQPDDDEIRILMAQSMVRLGMYDEAMAALEAIPEEDRGVEALFAIGRVAMTQGRVPEAREALVLALKERPQDPNILNSLLAVHDAEGQVEVGIRAIDEALKTAPDSADLWHVSGLAGIRTRDFDGAKSAFQKAIELQPDRVESYNQLARLYAASGQLDMALEQYVQASQKQPENATIRHFLGVLYEMTGQPSKASEQYELALQQNSNLAETKNNLAYMMAEQERDLDRALKLSQEAKAALPDSASAADTLGWVLYKRGVHSAAIGYLREAVAVSGSEDVAIGEIRLHLSRAYEATGDNAKALESLEAAMADIEILRRNGRLGRDDPPPPWEARVRTGIERLKTAS
jgi:tetratricopeptide (TPR) repeat protein